MRNKKKYKVRNKNYLVFSILTVLLMITLSRDGKSWFTILMSIWQLFIKLVYLVTVYQWVMTTLCQLGNTTIQTMKSPSGKSNFLYDFLQNYKCPVITDNKAWVQLIQISCQRNAHVHHSCWKCLRYTKTWILWMVRRTLL